MDSDQVNTILLIRYLEIPAWRWEVEHKSLPLLEQDITRLRHAGRYRSSGVASYTVVEARGKGTTSNPTLSMVCDDHSQGEFQRVFHEVISLWNTQQEILHECLLLEETITNALHKLDSTLENKIRKELRVSNTTTGGYYTRNMNKILALSAITYGALAHAFHPTILPSTFPNISLTYPVMFRHTNSHSRPRGN